MVDAVVSVCLEKLFKALEGEGRIMLEFRDQFERLRDELQLMQSFLKDAERLKKKSETLQTLMSSLRELIYEVEDKLADSQIQLNGNQDISGGYDLQKSDRRFSSGLKAKLFYAERPTRGLRY